MKFSRGRGEIESFKDKMANERKSFKWFFKTYVNPISCMSYDDFLWILNYDECLTVKLKDVVNTFMEKEK